jgi:hypothetical protein
MHNVEIMLSDVDIAVEIAVHVALRANRKFSC